MNKQTNRQKDRKEEKQTKTNLGTDRLDKRTHNQEIKDGI